MIQVDSESTPGLLCQGIDLFKALDRCMKTRRRRDRASDMITDLFLIIDAIAKRSGALEWNERVSAPDDEEDDQEHEPRIEVSLSEALSLAARHEEFDDHEGEYNDLAEANSRIRELQARLLDSFRSFIRYTTVGCKSAEEVTKKWLAVVRRVDPHSLRDIGMSQTAVARALGERRATTSAREQREFEVPMKRSGARGYHGTGGLRSQGNRDNCARAQRGNRNRATGHARQVSDEASGDPGIKATSKKAKKKS